MIESFSGEHRFLSNFAPSPITWRGHEWSTIEHAYQAAKAVDPAEADWVREAETPGKAKRRGRKVLMFPDWDKVKVTVMGKLLRLKFASEPLRGKLLATGDQPLVEGNHWGDRFWGICKGEGQNMLGKLLMEIRTELRKDDS